MENITSQRSLTAECRAPGYAACYVASWILKTIPIALLCLGTCGNILSLIVLSRKRLRRYSTTMYLLFLAVADLTLLWSSLLRRVILFTGRVDIRDLSEFHCRTNEWLAMTSGSFSIWLLVLLTIERTILTKSPRARSQMTRRFAFILSSALLAVIALINIHHVFGKRLRYTISKAYNVTEEQSQNSSRIVLQRTECTYVSPSYANFAQKLWPALGLAIYNLLPVILIFTGNFNILLKLRQQRRKLQPALQNPEYIGYDRNTKATKMLFVLCGFFLVTTTPYGFYFTVYYAIRKDLSDREFAGAKLAYSIIMILLWSNFTFNFLLYFVSGSLFKKEWTLMVADLKENICKSFSTRSSVQNNRPLVSLAGPRESEANNSRNSNNLFHIQTQGSS